jgi:hypothetical protein
LKLIKNFIAKYPHSAVNGLLLGSKSNKTEVVDAVPLFHQCLYVTPMNEIALIQVESKAANDGLQIIGYYAASENFYDNTIDKVPAIKIAEKIVENNGAACVFVVSWILILSLIYCFFLLMCDHFHCYRLITSHCAWI